MFITLYASKPSKSTSDERDTHSIYLRADNSACYTLCRAANVFL